MGADNGAAYHISALARGLTVLGQFDSPDVRLSLSEVAQVCDLNATTALRVLRTLEHCGHVERTAEGKLYKATEGAAFAGSVSRSGSTRAAAEAPDVLTVLGLFSEDNPELSRHDIVDMLGGDAALVEEPIGRAVEEGFLAHDSLTDSFRVGLRAVSLAYLGLARLPVRIHALPALSELVEVTGFDATLAVRRGDSAIYIVRLNAPEPWKGHTGVGRTVPLHGTAVGKVLLAYLEDGERHELLSALDRPVFTALTVTELSDLEAQLRTVRAAGYAVDEGEWMPGRGCVSAPVRDATGQVIAAIGASGDVDTLTERFARVSQDIRDCANQLSFALGYMHAYI